TRRSSDLRGLRFNLSTGHRRPWSGLLETPHADGPSGLGLSDGQTLECDCPEHVCLFREPDEPGDLPVGLRIAELRSDCLAPCFENRHCVRCKRLAFLGVGGSSPAFGGQEKLIDALWVARLGGG